MIPFVRAVAGVVLATALSGCSLNPALRVPPSSGASVRILSAVPFYPQTEYQCGPAALATVLGASGVPTSPDSLAPQVYLPGREGSLQLELVSAMRRAGRIPWVVEREPDAIFAELDKGRPVLVLQNLLTRTVPKWHYAVVVGRDASRNRVILNSGKRQGLSEHAPKFMRTWDWAGRWGLVSLRPGELPARADPVRYIAAVADFERVAGAKASAPAWDAAAERWPNHPAVLLSLGNRAVATGAWEVAARYFQQGLGERPADPVLGNNLASVLVQLGCRAEAQATLAAVQDPQGRWKDALAITAKEVSGMKANRGAVCDIFRAADQP